MARGLFRQPPAPQQPVYRAQPPPPPAVVTLGLLDASAALFAPTLANRQPITLPLLDASAALYAPTLIASIVLPLLDANEVKYAFDFSSGGQGWTTYEFYNNPGGNTGGWDSSVGGGSLGVHFVAAQFSTVYVKWHGTWEDLGVTPGAVVDWVRLGFAVKAILTGGSPASGSWSIESFFLWGYPIEGSGATLTFGHNYSGINHNYNYPAFDTWNDAVLGNTRFGADRSPSNTGVTLGFDISGWGNPTQDSDWWVDHIVVGMILSPLYAPTVAGAAQTITLGLLDAANALYAPTVSTSAGSLTVPLLDAGATLYAPTLLPKNAISPSLLDASAALYAPNVSMNLVMPLIDSGFALYPTTLSPGPVLVSLGLLDASGTVYAPTIIQGAGTISSSFTANAIILRTRHYGQGVW